MADFWGITGSSQPMVQVFCRARDRLAAAQRRLHDAQREADEALRDMENIYDTCAELGFSVSRPDSK